MFTFILICYNRICSNLIKPYSLVFISLLYSQTTHNDYMFLIYRAVVLDAVRPEVGSAELGAQSNCQTVAKSLTRAQYTARRMVKRQRVVDHVIPPHPQHVVQSSGYHVVSVTRTTHVTKGISIEYSCKGVECQRFSTYQRSWMRIPSAITLRYN